MWLLYIYASGVLIQAAKYVGAVQRGSKLTRGSNMGFSIPYISDEVLRYEYITLVFILIELVCSYSGWQSNVIAPGGSYIPQSSVN